MKRSRPDVQDGTSSRESLKDTTRHNSTITAATSGHVVRGVGGVRGGGAGGGAGAIAAVAAVAVRRTRCVAAIVPPWTLFVGLAPFLSPPDLAVAACTCKAWAQHLQSSASETAWRLTAQSSFKADVLTKHLQLFRTAATATTAAIASSSSSTATTKHDKQPWTYHWRAGTVALSQRRADDTILAYPVAHRAVARVTRGKTGTTVTAAAMSPMLVAVAGRGGGGDGTTVWRVDDLLHPPAASTQHIDGHTETTAGSVSKPLTVQPYRVMPGRRRGERGGPVSCLALQDPKWLYIGDAARCDVACVDLATRRRVSSFVAPGMQHSSPPQCLHVDGERLTVGHDNGSVTIYDMLTARFLSRVPGSGSVSHVAATPGGEVLMIGSASRTHRTTVALWDTRVAPDASSPLWSAERRASRRLVVPVKACGSYKWPYVLCVCTDGCVCTWDVRRGGSNMALQLRSGTSGDDLPLCAAAAGDHVLASSALGVHGQQGVVPQQARVWSTTSGRLREWRMACGSAGALGCLSIGEACGAAEVRRYGKGRLVTAASVTPNGLLSVVRLGSKGLLRGTPLLVHNGVTHNK